MQGWINRAHKPTVMLLAALATLNAGAQTDTTVPQALSIIGAVEDVQLVDGGLLIEARIDTGATSTSVDARSIESFQRDGRNWVRFELVTNDEAPVVMERRVVDSVTIVGAGQQREERPVVTLGLCLADVYRDVEVNLADREGLQYRLLIGRDVLADGGFLVNVAQQKSRPPRCDDVVRR